MAYKLIKSAQTRWRSVNAPELVALVRAGVKFEKGVMVERSEEADGSYLRECRASHVLPLEGLIVRGFEIASSAGRRPFGPPTSVNMGIPMVAPNFLVKE